jgi:predicted nucleotidyltransferase
MLNRVLPVLLASKFLEEQGIKTRIYGMRMYQRLDYANQGSRSTPKELNEFVNYTYMLKNYSQDIDFNWLAINLADTRFFRYNLFRFTSAMFQNEGINELGSGSTIYDGNKLAEVFGRYKNWYFEEMEAGRLEENPIDKRLIITGGFTPQNEIERDKIEEEFYRIIDVVDFQFNKADKTLRKIYTRFQEKYPNYSTYRLNDKFRDYVVKILTDAYSYPIKGTYATPQAEQFQLEKDYETKIEEITNFLSTLKE